MYQSKVTRLGLPCLILVCVNQVELEKSFIVSRLVILGPCSEFLVGRHERRSNIVRKKEAVGVDVEKLDGIAVSDNTSTTSLGNGFGRDDLPIVVSVGMAVSSDLLT